jgi:AraC-like DNA-binding protein
VAVVLDAAKVPAPRRELTARKSTATTVVMLNVSFQCAPEEISRRLRHWRLGRAHLICPGSALRFGADVGGASIRAIIVIPVADLSLPSDVIRRATRTLPSSPVYDLLRQHVARLFRDADKITQPGTAAMVGRATIELVRALVSSAGRDPGGGDTWDQTLETRLVAYIEQHLKDSDLRAEELARVHGISVRQLYKLWSSHETSLSQWIIRQRLEGARADLSAGDNGHATIAVVAHRWGFVNATHFSRRFREVYGISPREWQRVPEKRER